MVTYSPGEELLMITGSKRTYKTALNFYTSDQEVVKSIHLLERPDGDLLAVDDGYLRDNYSVADPEEGETWVTGEGVAPRKILEVGKKFIVTTVLDGFRGETAFSREDFFARYHRSGL